MRVILQRVSKGSVTVEGKIMGSVENGYVALVGITHEDTNAIVEAMAKKTAHLRVFEDAEGKMNLSLLDVGGGVLVVSQFTLYADMRRGRRPSFIDAASPAQAAPMVQYFGECLQAEGVSAIGFGVFGAMMHVEIHNDGPVTIILDSDEWVK